MRADQLRPGQVLDLVDDEALAPDDPALAHEEDLDRGLELVVGDADHVEVLVAVGHHLLLLDGLAHRREPVAQAGGPLELELVGGAPASPASSRLTTGVGVAVEELEQLARPARRSARLSISPTHGPGALLDVEQQAGPAEPLVAPRTCCREQVRIGNVRSSRSSVSRMA